MGRIGESEDGDRVALALARCQEAMRVLMPRQRARVLRGLHAWYTAEVDDDERGDLPADL